MASEITINYDELEQAFAGMLADARYKVIESYAAEGDIDFGLAVSRGTDPDHQVELFGGDNFAGFAVHKHREIGKDRDEGYADEDTVGVLRQGVIWVPMVDGQEPAKDGAVFVVDSGDDQGKVRTDDGGDSASEVDAVFYGSADNGLAPVVVNLPQS